MRRIWILTLLLLTDCTGNVTNSVIQQAQLLFSVNKGQISLVSNSTGQQATCASGNTVVLQVSLPAQQTFYCSDQSVLMSGVQLGQTCPGGVNVSATSESNTAVNCSKLTLCGVAPTSMQSLTPRADGSSVVQLTFSNLPWGCNAQLQYSTDPTFPASSTTTLSTQVIPPTCPFCITTNGPTCLACAALGTNQTVISGQVVLTSCSSGSCASCSVVTPTGTVSVAHGQSYTFYSAPQNSCPGHCNQLSQVRVCNNGLFEGGAQYTFPQCVDAGCGCQLPGIGAVFNSGQKYTLYSTSKPACPNFCSTSQMQAQCLDGVWETTSGTPLTSSQLTTYTYNQCQDPVCTCSIAGLLIPYGQNATVYSTNKVSCTDTCSAHAGAVTCSSQGVLSAAQPAYLNYAYSSCTQAVCSCPLPWGGSLANGATTTAYNLSQATCSSPTACSTAGNSVQVTCTNGQLSTFNQTTFKYPSCSVPVCSCSANGVQVALGGSAYFYQMQNPTSPLSCAAVSGLFQCSSTGVLTGPSNISQFPYTTCTSASDQGTLGGTGGGTGNSNGPGSAIKQVYGLGDGGGGAGEGCVDAVSCSGSAVNSVPSPVHPQSPCTLPWAATTGFNPAEIEFYGTVMAFNTQCVVKPDLCSKHRQSRTCHFPNWTGDPTYQYPNCVEKTSCP